MKKIFISLLIGIILGGGAGFALGIYLLPVIVEWQNRDAAPVQVVEAMADDPVGQFDRSSPGSDALHWGEGTVRVTDGVLVFEDDVELAPGPDYRIYLTRKFADTKEDFLLIKAQAKEVAKLKVFSGPLSFAIPPDVNTDVYDNVLVWCEAFSMYIASARLE